jgi:hypothetical protein
VRKCMREGEAQTWKIVFNFKKDKLFYKN